MPHQDLFGVVDFDRLLAFAAGDAVIADEVLGLFCEQAELWFRLMGPDQADAGGYRDAAHTMKGAALGIGADELGAACAEAEAAAGEPPALRAAIAERVRTALDRALNDIAIYRHATALKALS